jgi:Dolichyl-phosphate-mannose-protein mannosyltransferase
VSTNEATLATARTAAPGHVAAKLSALVRSADAQALTAVMIVFSVLAAISWRKWGTPEIDAGVDLTTAAQATHGHLPYEDVRYFYGPLGIYVLTGVFKVFGTNLTAAFGLGLVVAAAITVSFYALARQLLRPSVAALSTAVLVAIGFSGMQFNFVLPHTSSATFGLLLLLLELLALARRRPLLAGVALGLACLTRVEFAAAAVAVGAAWLLGTWRAEGRGPALAAGVRLAAPAAAIAGTTYAVLAASVGTSRLLWENLWPADFLRIAGFRAYREWTPFDAASVASSVARAAVYGGLLAGLVMSCARLRGTRGLARARALSPLVAAGVAIAVVGLLWRASGVFADAQAAVEEESRQLLIGMTALPALALVVAAAVGYRFVRGRPPLLSRSWGFDLALAASAVLLCSRAYDQFTMSSAAPYYAAPAVLLLGLLHQRLADRSPTARIGVLAALGAVAAGIALYNTFALYGDKSTVVRTAAGSYVANDRSAGAQQQVIDFLRTHTAPGEPILALPADGGTYFFTDRQLPLYDVATLPGLLDSAHDERAAIARLRQEHVRYAVVSTRDTTAFETGRFGTGYNRILGAYIDSGQLVKTIGDPRDAAGGGIPSRSFRIYELDAG